jgi:hypothetical protein
MHKHECFIVPGRCKGLALTSTVTYDAEIMPKELVKSTDGSLYP